MATATETGRPTSDRHALQRAFRARMASLADLIVAKASPGELEAAASASTDLAAALEGMSALLERAPIEEIDPLAAARLRGVEAKRRLIAKAGGLLDAKEVAALLGIGEEAVAKRRQAGKLLAMPRGARGHVFPACQFRANAPIPGIERVLAAARGLPPWMLLDLLTSPQDELGGRTPLEALGDGEIEDAEAVAAAITAPHD